MSLLSVPHSEEWFKAFEKYNPLLAQLTKNMVARVGHVNICSTCGGIPLGDYQLKHGFSLVLRLCEVCKDIYSRAYGDGISRMPQNDNSAVQK